LTTAVRSATIERVLFWYGLPEPGFEVRNGAVEPSGKQEAIFKITRQTDYGILILTSVAQGLASGVDPMRVYSAPEIASLTGLALPNVSKILKALVRAQLLESRRGVQGGYKLARLPGQINLQQMVEALDGPISLTVCADSGPEDCEIGSLCPLSSNWKFINDRICETLNSITLEQMAVPGGVVPALAASPIGDPSEDEDV
jgi:FeS assembly SUF system regulator